MRLVEVNGNVLVVYYPVEEKDSSLIMMNYSEGGLLKMYLKERRMERGVFVGKTTGTAYPLDQIPPDKSRLPLCLVRLHPSAQQGGHLRVEG